MHTGAAIPSVHESARLSEALVEMTKKGLGMTAIVDDRQRLAGIFTDGDLRRALDRKVDVHEERIAKVITRNCKTITPDMLAAEALQLMETHKINALLVVNEDKALVGALNMHDLLRAGVV
jgi:arabinose-5-phosphate isomerase